MQYICLPDNGYYMLWSAIIKTSSHQNEVQKRRVPCGFPAPYSRQTAFAICCGCQNTQCIHWHKIARYNSAMQFGATRSHGTADPRDLMQPIFQKYCMHSVLCILVRFLLQGNTKESHRNADHVPVQFWCELALNQGIDYCRPFLSSCCTGNLHTDGHSTIIAWLWLIFSCTLAPFI